MTNSTDIDIRNAGCILFGHTSTYYDMIYANSNESLDMLFSNVDFKDKDALTVLSSSDQLFNILVRGARKVDTYDINKLTKYYFYLRKWNIIYNNEYSMPSKITGEFIFNLLSKVNVKSFNEEEAYIFWKTFIYKYPSYLYRYLFNTSSRVYTIDSIVFNDLRDKLFNYDLDFKCLDLSDEVDIEKKYDFIITSNISEYFCDDEEQIIRYRDNLYKLLNKEGKVVCSHLMDRYTSVAERRIFKQFFSREEFPKYYDEKLGCYFPPGYSYTKKI